MKVIGKGSVTRLEKKPRAKCRKWKIRIQTDEGEKTRRFAGTYSEAQAAKELYKGELSVPSIDKGFSLLADEWMTARKKTGNLADLTVVKYETELRLLVEEFGADRVRDIDRARAEEGLLNIKYGRGQRVDVISGTYMNQLHTRMKAVMQRAVDDEIIGKNPLARVEAPKVDTQSRTALDRGTFARFLRTLDALPLDARTVALRIAVLAGLRHGEIMGLRWRDVSAGLIRVRRSFDEKHAKVNDRTKTPSGIRDVPSIPYLDDVLGRWREVQRLQLSELGLVQDEDTPVITSAAGTVMRPQNLRRWWNDVRGPVFGVEGIVIHELRHTYLTILGNEGAPGRAIMSIAGWANLGMAARYVHEDAEANERAVGKLGNIVEFEVAKRA